jgi:hypothetical protein
MDQNKDIYASNIIGLNPTGIMDFNGTYTMNGTNNIIRNTSTAAKENLAKAQNNQIICDHVENFHNMNSNKNYYIFTFIIILIILIIIFLLI